MSDSFTAFLDEVFPNSKGNENSNKTDDEQNEMEIPFEFIDRSLMEEELLGECSDWLSQFLLSR